MLMQAYICYGSLKWLTTVSSLFSNFSNTKMPTLQTSVIRENSIGAYLPRLIETKCSVFKCTFVLVNLWTSINPSNFYCSPQMLSIFYMTVVDPATWQGSQRNINSLLWHSFVNSGWCFPWYDFIDLTQNVLISENIKKFNFK